MVLSSLPGASGNSAFGQN